jgi:hypothetical protein
VLLGPSPWLVNFEAKGSFELKKNLKKKKNELLQSKEALNGSASMTSAQGWFGARERRGSAWLRVVMRV